MSQSEETKIAVMQEKVNTLDRNMEAVMTNHLPHIYEELKAVRKEIAEIKQSIAKYIGIGVGALGVIDIGIRLLFGK